MPSEQVTPVAAGPQSAGDSPLPAPRSPFPSRPWLPWIAAGVVLGASGLCGPGWWWLALLVAPVSAWGAVRFPHAARAGIGLAAFVAGGVLAPTPGPVSGEPRLLSATGTVATVLWTGHQQGFVVRVASTDDPQGFVPASLVVRAPPLPGVVAGDAVSVQGLWLRDERGAHLQATTCVRQTRETGVRGFAWQAIDRLAVYREVGAALLLGRGDPPEKELFRRTGLIHLLAVSGMHLALAAALGAWLLRQCGIAWHYRQLALGALLIGYTWLTAASPATVRALAMALALLLYGLLAREPHRLGAVALAVLALVLWDPGMARDLGFQLSLVAVLGLLTLGLDLVRWRERVLPLRPLPLDRPSWRGLLFAARSGLDGLAIGTAATLATLPVLAGAFGAISPWSAVTTLLAAPPSTLALWTGLPLITLAGIWPAGPWEGLYLVVEGCLTAFVGAVQLADLLPGRIPWPLAPWWVLALWPLLFVPTLRSSPEGLAAVPGSVCVRLGGALVLLVAWVWCG